MQDEQNSRKAAALESKKKRIFSKEIKNMMTAFGDQAPPKPESVELIECMTMDYLKQMILKAVEINGHNRITLDDVLFVVANDVPKYTRIKELLEISEKIPIVSIEKYVDLPDEWNDSGNLPESLDYNLCVTCLIYFTLLLLLFSKGKFNKFFFTNIIQVFLLTYLILFLYGAIVFCYGTFSLTLIIVSSLLHKISHKEYFDCKSTDFLIRLLEDEKVLENSQILSIFGCWLGAFTIPLDWDRPWQMFSNKLSIFLFFISFCSIYSSKFYKSSIKKPSWENCYSNSPMFVQNLTFPDPLLINRDNTFSITLDQKRTIDSPLKGKLEIEYKVGPVYVEIPCIDDYGSCTYDDLCKRLESVQCPPELKEQHFNCTCPIIGPNIVQVNNITLPLHPPAKLSIPTGDYKLKLSVDNEKDHMFCLEVFFKIEND
ncbi:hypothetical protein SNEBB_006036 [Seison nebaliae]|nr:hypothetical protein SNEBB_006036 [Seison nebaliae]